jgi:regulator of protease activity HflC (stomatin/prohibitin superfamily)
MVRVVTLIVSALITLPVLSIAYALLSAASDLRVALGCAMLIGIGVGWYSLLRDVIRLSAPQVRRWIGVMILFLTAVSVSACGRTIVEPGHVGIQVDYYGQDRGVESYPKVTGVVWYNPVTTKVLQYPTFVQTAVWTHNINEGNPFDESISFTTSDQMQVAADVSLAYHLTSDRVPAFYVKFRSDDLRTFTHGFLRNLAREKFDAAAGRYKIEQIMGDNAPFLKDARTMLQADLDPIGVQLDQFGLIGAPRPPQQVIEAINAKVQATQNAIRVENEVRQAKAQAEKNVAEAEGQARAAIARAEGDAKANQVLSSSITPTLVEWRKLEIQQHAIEKWNGNLPTYSGNTVPFLSLPATPASH